MQLSQAKRFQNMEVRYFPDHEIVILRNVKAQLLIRFDTIAILDQNHEDLKQIEDVWLKIRSQLQLGAEPDKVKFIQLADNVSFFDENNVKLKDCTPFQSRGIFSILLEIRGVTKRVDGDEKFNLITRAKQVKMEEYTSDNTICRI